MCQLLKTCTKLALTSAAQLLPTARLLADLIPALATFRGAHRGVFLVSSSEALTLSSGLRLEVKVDRITAAAISSFLQGQTRRMELTADRGGGDGGRCNNK